MNKTLGIVLGLVALVVVGPIVFCGGCVVLVGLAQPALQSTPAAKKRKADREAAIVAEAQANAEAKREAARHYFRHGNSQLAFGGGGKNSLPIAKGVAGPIWDMKILQIVGRDKMRVEIGDSTLIAVGWNTAGFVDGQTITDPVGGWITGATTYKTVLGATKTVFVIEPLNLEQARK